MARIDQIYQQKQIRLYNRNRRLIEKIVNQAGKDIAQMIRLYRHKLPKTGPGGFFAYNKDLANNVESLLRGMSDSVTRLIEGAQQDAWELAESKNNVLVEAYTKNIDVPQILTKEMLQLNYNAMKAFIERVDEGLNLSARVWKDTKIANSQIELYLGSGIAEGKSAAALSRDVRSVLRQPNKLFRRVRDADGNLVLSKAAKKYHPGRGIYRSSYKNALRLTRTEINMAYHRADYLRRQSMAFVTGIRVKLSASHPIYDICDEMIGEYPKGFLFIGWHPQCICYSESILLKKEDFKKYLQTGKIDQRKLKRAIPQSAQRYIDKHGETMKSWKTKPYWLDENFTDDLKLKESRI